MSSTSPNATSHAVVCTTQRPIRPCTCLEPQVSIVAFRLNILPADQKVNHLRTVRSGIRQLGPTERKGSLLHYQKPQSQGQPQTDAPTLLCRKDHPSLPIEARPRVSVRLLAATHTLPERRLLPQSSPMDPFTLSSKRVPQHQLYPSSRICPRKSTIAFYGNCPSFTRKRSCVAVRRVTCETYALLR